MEIAWTSDGTQLAGAGGNGSVVFAQLVQRKLEWENFEVTLIEPKLINVQDASIGPLGIWGRWGVPGVG